MCEISQAGESANFGCNRNLRDREPRARTTRPVEYNLVRGATALAVLALSACGGGSSGTTFQASNQSAYGFAAQILNQHSDAVDSGAQLTRISQTSSPFIDQITVRLASTESLGSVEFIIQPKAGALSQAVDVTYTGEALIERGYMSSRGFEFTLPVFGLYAGYTNQVTLNLHFLDGSTLPLPTRITTPAYVDPTGIYQHPTILKQRSPDSTLGFSYFYMKSGLGSPVVMDTDGEIRWVMPGMFNSMTSAFQDDEFVIGDPNSPTISRLRLDGALTTSTASSTDITNFHHNIDHGNVGFFADVTTSTNGVVDFEATVNEMSDHGSSFKQWDMAAIISTYMQSQGDDPSTFVRPGADWFHNNASAYDPSDNSVIISSRENFVIKVDYETGAIIWILGDPTKYWYTFPSLRAKALTLAPGGLYPIGQHAVSMTADGHLLLFNDGLGSQNQPAGAPAGESRTYSAVSAYSIDAKTMTAENVWNFDYGQTIYSLVCSSAYKAAGNSLLIDYATADYETLARLVGLDSTHSVAFDFQFPTTGCDTSWNALPLPFENLTID